MVADAMTAGLQAHVHALVGDFTLTAQVAVDADETVAIVGPNGAGKTTLLRAIAGLLPLEKGCVVLDGRVLDEPATGAWVAPEDRRVGVVFQDDVLFPHLTALENVAFGIRARRRPRAEAHRLAAEWLERVGLSALASTRPGRLSGGQAQRVALARALAAEPALVVLDEPFAALDVTARRAIRRDMQQHISEIGVPRILITHDPIDAAAIANRLVVLEEGKIVQEGTLTEITTRPRSRYVADFVGTNLLRGQARGTTVDTGAAEVVTSEAADGDVLLTIPPRAVVLSQERLHTTARNAWLGTICDVEAAGPVTRIRVRAAVDLVAEVTAGSADALGLTVGSPVWATVKATEVIVHPA